MTGSNCVYRVVGVRVGGLVVAIWEGNAKRTVLSLHFQRFVSLYKRSQSFCHCSFLFRGPLATLADPLYRLSLCATTLLLKKKLCPVMSPSKHTLSGAFHTCGIQFHVCVCLCVERAASND